MTSGGGLAPNPCKLQSITVRNPSQRRSIVKKLFWFLATSMVILSTFSNPPQVKADGNPLPVCPPNKVGCKPAA